jgi:lipid II:glycine glycyltransferase (peptidoglycan interpeptide bridge formation enzyme)
MLQKSHQTETYFEVSGIFIEKRKVALQEYWLFVIWLESEKQKVESLMENLIELCKKENALFIQVETLNYDWKSPYPPLSRGKYLYSSLPPWLGGSVGDGGTSESEDRSTWAYKKFITPHTAIIDLTKTEDEILAKMKQKGRYNIRLAEKKWIEVKEVDKSKENVKIFYDLMKETTSRDGFSWNTLDYYFEFLNNLKNSKLLFASFEWKIISAWIFVYTEDVAIYYYGASTSNEKFRNLMAPYLLQWNAILIWKKLWCKIYDFLGVATPWDKNSKLAWVTDFKMKFTQDIREISKSYIWINKKWKYYIIQCLRKLRKGY